MQEVVYITSIAPLSAKVYFSKTQPVNAYATAILPFQPVCFFHPLIGSSITLILFGFFTPSS